MALHKSNHNVMVSDGSIHDRLECESLLVTTLSREADESVQYEFCFGAELVLKTNLITYM
jgi:hypothetical protein